MSNTTTTSDWHKNNYATPMTNFAYVVPIFVLIYKGRWYYWPEIFALVGVFFYSFVYHMCQDTSGNCPHDEDVPLTMQFDLTAAYLAVAAGPSPLIYSFAYVKMRQHRLLAFASMAARGAYFIVNGIFVFIFMTFSSPNQEYLAFSFIGTTAFITIIYCFVQRNRVLTQQETIANARRGNKEESVFKTTKRQCAEGTTQLWLKCVLGLIFFGLAGICRLVLWTTSADYNLWHSLWHAFGAIGLTFFYIALPDFSELIDIIARAMIDHVKQWRADSSELENLHSETRAQQSSKNTSDDEEGDPLEGIDHSKVALVETSTVHKPVTSGRSGVYHNGDAKYWGVKR